MINRIKTYVSALLASVLMAFPVLAPVTVAAQDTEPGLCQGAKLQVNDPSCDPKDTTAENRINDILTLVINIFSLVVGVVSVIMIIIGGLKYITSSGDTGNVTAAKNTIIYAVIGLVVVALAQFIVRFVLSRIASTG